MPVDADRRPDYPPKTPPPPKRPVEPPRPEPQGFRPAALVSTVRRGVTLRNRRGVNWPLEAAPWSASKASRRVLEQLREWGYRPSDTATESVAAVVTLLVTGALGDGSRRISVHLSDQGRQVCVLVLSHQVGLPVGHVPDGDDVLKQVTEHKVVSGCGSDLAPDGRRLWAVVDL
jgi:hypothetical protein